MDAADQAAHSDAGGFRRAVAKIVRLRRTAGRGKNGAETRIGLIPDDARGGFRKVKFTEYLDGSSALSRSDYVDDDDDDDKKRHHELRHREAMESLLAELFASVSAIKAAYAQLQIAESPYDPDTIQSADDVVVSGLKRLSQLKRAYVKNQTHVHGCGGSAAGGDYRLVAEAQEQRNLLKAFQITAKKLERDLQQKDSEVALLKNQLSETEMLNRWAEERFHRHGLLSRVDGLHLSVLNPTHFLAVLRYAVKSVRSYVRLMVKEMQRAGWDLAAAAGSISPDVLSVKPEHLAFAFESYVCRTVFSGFQNHDFGLGGGGQPDRRRCFEEFAEVKAASPKEMLDSQNGEPSLLAFQRFCREKYLALVHPLMEESFFGNLNQRTLVSSSCGFPGTEFFMGFAEVARRVWVLHRLFFSFEREVEATIFQVGRGCRFSEVYMESVAGEDAGEWGHVVGFTVVPGFKVGKTVIQCRVYPARPAAL